MRGGAGTRHPAALRAIGADQFGASAVLRSLMAQVGWSVTRAARVLGTSDTAVYAWLDRYEVAR